LFSAAPAHFVAERLAGQGWPDQHRFPVNLPARTVAHVVLTDLLASAEPLVVAGYASLVEVVGLAARWAKRHEEGSLRVLVGSEPFDGRRNRLGPAVRVFTDEVAAFWLGQGFCWAPTSRSPIWEAWETHSEVEALVHGVGAQGEAVLA